MVCFQFQDVWMVRSVTQHGSVEPRSGRLELLGRSERCRIFRRRHPDPWQSYVYGGSV
jgi:hypothetical protein